MHDKSAVDFDGLLRDLQLSGNLFVQAAADDVFQHLALARGKTLDAGLNPLHFLAVKLGRGMPLQRSSGARSSPCPSRRGALLAAMLAGDLPFTPEAMPFDHPLWVVYSSGTTGLPKPIVHGHGGVMLEALKLGVLHNNLGPSVETGERFGVSTGTGINP